MLARKLANETSEILEAETRTHFVRGLVADMGELRDAGFPLSASGFRPGAAKLKTQWDILIQSGRLQAAYGRDPVRFDLVNRSWSVFVGFDDSGASGRRGRSFGDITSAIRNSTVDMASLLSWLLDGTSTMVGRPILVNSFAQAYPSMVSLLAGFGLRRLARTGIPRLYPVSTGPRNSPIRPTR